MTEIAERLGSQIAELEREIADREDQVLDGMAAGQDVKALVSKQEQARVELARLKLARERAGAAEEREATKTRLLAMKTALVEVDGIEKRGRAAVSSIVKKLREGIAELAEVERWALPPMESRGFTPSPDTPNLVALRHELKMLPGELRFGADPGQVAEVMAKLEAAGAEDIERVCTSLRTTAQAWIKESERLLAERKAG